MGLEVECAFPMPTFTRNERLYVSVRVICPYCIYTPTVSTYCVHFILSVVWPYRLSIVSDEGDALFFSASLLCCLRLDSSMSESAEKLSYLQSETYSTHWTNIKHKWILPSGVEFKNLYLWTLSVGRRALHAPTCCPLFLNLRSLVNSFQNIYAQSNSAVSSGLIHVITLCNDVWNAAELSVMNMYVFSTCMWMEFLYSCFTDNKMLLKIRAAMITQLINQLVAKY